MAIEYTNLFHFKAPQNLDKYLIFGLKINHLATLVEPGDKSVSQVQ
jgi:hypothetical protein